VIRALSERKEHRPFKAAGIPFVKDTFFRGRGTERREVEEAQRPQDFERASATWLPTGGLTSARATAASLAP